MMTFSIQSHHYSDTRLQWLHIIFPEASESDHSPSKLDNEISGKGSMSWEFLSKPKPNKKSYKL